MPPAKASSRDSRNRGRSSWAREAPRAERTASSRARAMVRASRRFARLEQAMSSTNPERPINMPKMPGPLSGATATLSGRVRQIVPALTAGKSAARRRPKLAMKPSPCARVRVLERRPTRRSQVALRSVVSFSLRPSGRKTSNGPKWRQSFKVAGSTPTISWPSPSMRTVRPMTWPSPPKRFCQNR